VNIILFAAFKRTVTSSVTNSRLVCVSQHFWYICHVAGIPSASESTADVADFYSSVADDT